VVMPSAAAGLSKLLSVNGEELYQKFIRLATEDPTARPAILERKLGSSTGRAWSWGNTSRREQSRLLEACRKPETVSATAEQPPVVPSATVQRGQIMAVPAESTQAPGKRTRKSGRGCRQRRTIRRLKEWYYTRGLDWLLRSHYDSITELERIIFESWLRIEAPDDYERLVLVHDVQ
jgi:hypothetical protein